MTPSILDYILANKSTILNRVNSFRDSNRECVKHHWIDYAPRSLNGNSVAGVDGGRGVKVFREYSLYVVDGVGVVYSGYERGELIETFDVDLLVPQGLVDIRTRLLMQIVEAKTALKALNEGCNLVLCDGSLVSSIVFRSIVPYQSVENIDLIISEVSALNSEKLVSKPILSKNYASLVLKNYGEKAKTAMAKIEASEMLTTYRRLLEEYGSRVVWVSKTSTGTELLKTFIPDITILQYLTRGTGYTRPIQISISRPRKWSFPVHDDFFHGYELTLFYTRFEERGLVYRVEVPGRVDEDWVEWFMDSVCQYCVEGYPYMLREADRIARVSRRDMETVMRVLGIVEARTGREALAK